MRSGFSIIFALMILVIVAILSILTLSISAQTTQVTVNRYIREQVELLAYSATQMAYQEMKNENIYKLDLNTSNLNNILQCFDANVSVSSERNISNKRVLVLDTYVTLKENETNCNIEPKINFHRRTIQEIRRIP